MKIKLIKNKCAEWDEASSSTVSLSPGPVLLRSSQILSAYTCDVHCAAPCRFLFYTIYTINMKACGLTKHTHTHILLQVILNPPPGRWDSKDNSKVWLYILFTQTSCKLYLSPSSCVLWGSSRSQHPSHFTRPACLSSPLLSGDLHYSPPDLSVSEQWRWTCVTSPQIVCPHTSSLKASKLEQACYARVCCDSLSTGWYNSDAKRKKKRFTQNNSRNIVFLSS